MLLFNFISFLLSAYGNAIHSICNSSTAIVTRLSATLSSIGRRGEGRRKRIDQHGNGSVSRGILLV